MILLLLQTVKCIFPSQSELSPKTDTYFDFYQYRAGNDYKN